MKKLFFVILIIGLAFAVYKYRQNNPPTATTLSQEAAAAKIKATDNGPLSICTIDNTQYFLAQGIVFDGSNNLYDMNGDPIVQCGGGWGIKPDPYPAMCVKLETASCTPLEE